MNSHHLEALSTYFNLGNIIDSPTKVYGGLLHIMWKVTTDKASYAIKQLSKDIDITNQKIIDNYNLSEKIAASFAQHNIPSVSAIENLYLIDQSAYLVYPWMEAESIKEPNQSQALKIANILAKIHEINLKIPEIEDPKFIVHEPAEIRRLFEKAKLTNLDNILIANENYQDSIAHLKQHLVVSHGDLDPKNVLWDKQDNPYLIDWESAKLINPTYEIINTSLDFCGIGNNFNQEQFFEMIKAYGVLDQKDIKYAFGGVLGNWINWLVFNIERSFSEDFSIKKRGEIQVKQTMNIILKVQELIPKLEEKMK